MPSLSDRINAAEESLVAKRDALTSVFDTDVDESGDLTEDGALKADELTSQIEKAESDIARLKKAESALRSQVKTAVDSQGDRNPYVSMQKHREKGDLFFKLATTKAIAHMQRLNPAQVATSVFKDDPEVGVILKAESEPASASPGSSWGPALVQETTAQFLDLVRDRSAYAQAPGDRVQFGPYGRIIVPYNSSRGALAGGFVGEGEAIRVGQGGFSSKDMSSKHFAIITTLTKAMDMQGIPATQAIIRKQMIEDTAEALDAAFLDDHARTTTRPAGLQNDPDGAGAANVNASLGATVANITSDLKGALGRAMAARVASGGAWLMNPLRRLGLMTVQDAASGEYPFRDEVNRGTLFGYPIISSQNVPEAVVTFIPNGCVMYGNDYSPRIDVSDSATLHMEDTSALPVVDGAGVAAAPVRSLFQTDTIGIRLTMGLDWIVTRPNGVQVLTGVAW